MAQVSYQHVQQVRARVHPLWKYVCLLTFSAVFHWDTWKSCVNITCPVYGDNKAKEHWKELETPQKRKRFTAPIPIWQKISYAFVQSFCQSFCSIRDPSSRGRRKLAACRHHLERHASPVYDGIPETGSVYVRLRTWRSVWKRFVSSKLNEMTIKFG